MKSFGWVYLFFVSLTLLKLTCSPGFWNQTCRFIDGFPGTCSYWSTLCSTFLMPLFISCRSSCCCGLRVRVFVWAGRSLPHPPSLPPLCTFCHCLSPPSLPLERSPVWEPQSVHRGKSSAGNHTRIRRPFINAQNPPQYCSLKGSWEVGFVFMQNDHLRSSLLQIFHGSQMKLLLHISWSGWDRGFCAFCNWLAGFSLFYSQHWPFWACLTGI